MGFYGNTTDTSNTHFQFDKIFPNRAAMDQACANGTDGVYTGRFVLIRYGEELNFQNHMLYGFVKEGDECIYIDSLFRQPYRRVVYIPVEQSIQGNWNIYYEKNGNAYSQLKNKEDYDSEKTYYITSVKNADGTDRDDIVTEGIIIYRKNTTTKVTEGKFYKCIGQNDDGTAKWELINDQEQFEQTQYKDYLTNFYIDFATYENNFDNRGYDATVWEKVYTEGIGRFIQIARLNGSIPAFEIHGDVPSKLPAAPYIDTKSSNDVYHINVPSSWGFRIKEANNTNFSDEDITQTYYTYDEDNKLRTQDRFIHADIYFNESGKSASFKNHDDNTKNEILFAPTGKSGKRYYNHDGENVEEIDTYELSIHLPAFGNMISDGYDVIYGENEPTTTEEGEIFIQRPMDVDWYSGNDSEELRKNGRVDKGGKTYDLTTFAGNINTMHNILGQIIVDLDTPPTIEQIASYSPNLLYRLENVLYRRGIVTIPTLVDESEYFFVRQTDNISKESFKNNKYYVVKDEVILPENSADWTYEDFEPARGYNEEINRSHGYFLKNINRIRYTKISLEPFNSGEVYWKDGSNYYCDHSAYTPRYLNRTYYKNIQAVEKKFDISYAADGSLYTKKDGIYTASYSIDPNQLSEKYYGINRSALYAGAKALYYHANSYYYQEPGDSEWHFADENHVYNSHNSYYAFTFSDTPSYGLNADGTVIRYYPVEKREEVNLLDFPSNQTEDSIYISYKGQYIPYSKLSTLGIIDGKDPYTIPWVMYTITVNEYSSDKIFFPNVYHIVDYDNSYILSSAFDPSTKYYQIVSVETIENPFYIPEKYWYNVGGEEYILDESNSMTLDRVYYTKTALYVYYDEEQQCPRGYEWSSYAPYIPPSITLCTFTEQLSLIKLSEFDETTDTLYGLLLKINALYNNDNEIDRNTKSIRGIYNNLRDMLYQVKNLRPGQVLYTNDFGQIESFNPGSNQILMTNSLGQLKPISVSDLKTLLNNA